jgi:hypothetical protein
MDSEYVQCPIGINEHREGMQLILVLNCADNSPAGKRVQDENSEARQAVVEGQAMVVLLDYMLAPAHRTAADSPEMVDMLNKDMRSGTPDSVQYKNAPIFLKESLTFPYRYGVEFEAELVRAQGKEKAFTSTFQNPPRTSREIMEPRTYISGERLLPLELPDFKRVRVASGRFRGLRCIHTHLRGEQLTQDDLTDLALLRLDLMAAIDVDEQSGLPGVVRSAHLLPSNSTPNP